MNNKETIDKLTSILEDNEMSEEKGHRLADQILLDVIDDEKVTEAFNKIYKWYS